MFQNLPHIAAEDYHYHLPEDKIAKFPLKNRQESKLLWYNQGSIDHKSFSDVGEIIPPDALLYFNNTKVIPARLNFAKSTGAAIEVLLMDPQDHRTPIHQALQQTSPVYWHCLIGNKKKWKGTTLSMNIGSTGATLVAELVDSEKNIVRFSWDKPEYAFLEIIEKAGKAPLPPYLKRQPAAMDKIRYQTVYSEKEGAVAAPTAGLHFTTEMINLLRTRGHVVDFLTLHVGAGTFQPIKEANVVDHPMHNEQILVSLKNLENLLQNRFTIAVGTTSLRTLESLYWYGVKLLNGQDETFKIEKLAPYMHHKALPERREAIRAVENYMSGRGMTELIGETEILIVPGYHFKVCDGLFTNFHLPGSTLILLVAAFIGQDWKLIYNAALQKNYRFLSYGDSSLLIRK